MENELNIKQVLFLNEWEANNYNQTLAYQKIYGQEDYGLAAASAARLMQKEGIIEELKRRQGKVELIADIKREDQVKQLKKIILETKSESIKLKALDQLNKMAGYYKAENVINVDAQSIKLSFGNGFNPNNVSDEIPSE